ncbi:hypothetical protein HIRU_S761 [Hirudovirus strain Sangsue]|nr:hypothetical protein HIRU_S761 [Hirudovirus strain Sangsue]
MFNFSKSGFNVTNSVYVPRQTGICISNNSNTVVLNFSGQNVAGNIHGANPMGPLSYGPYFQGGR